MDLFDTTKDNLEFFFARLASRGRFDQGNVLESVSKIVEDVKKHGDEAVIRYTAMFDKVELSGGAIRVTPEEMDAAYKKVEPGLIEVIRKAKHNIESFHLKQKENSWFSPEKNGAILGQLFRPLETVGIYVPGGTAALTSSVLMNAIPAKVAGVGRLVMATPPCRDGSVSASVLVAAREAGVDEIYRVGGAQAVAALAFGTAVIPKVDKIIGPGNIYVATAKRMVFGYCDIDMFAGPSEITVVADDSANARFVAADLLSQAEHDILASAVLVTTSGTLAQEVLEEVQKQMEVLPRKNIIEKSLKDYCAVIIAESLDEALDITNRIAPEHLELCVREPFDLLGSVKNAGAVFLGSYSSEPLGDYFAGPNHVLPTSGTARFFSPLSVSDFVKKTSVISYTQKALQEVKDDVIAFAESEGLGAHANAIRVRFKKD